MLKDLVLKNRSYRRFHQEIAVSNTDLVELIDLARLAPSAKNNQPLKYYISNTADINNKIFKTLAWAGYLTDWAGPIDGERPRAYIVVFLDKNITDNNYCDHGLAVQNILLGAVEKQLGGCIIAAFNRKKISSIINTDTNLEPILVLAIGKPKEEVNLYEINSTDEVKYWRNNDQIHQVPKRKLNDIIIK